MFRNLDSANSHARLDKTLDKTMSEEQFNQIVEAILSGKYSWACLLILRFSGYNPLHYIPYRTYNRLMKVNRTSSTPAAAGKYSNLLEDDDVGYLEEIDCQSDQITGGRGVDSLAMLRGMIWSEFNF